jgi:hypothetical protein
MLILAHINTQTSSNNTQMNSKETQRNSNLDSAEYCLAKHCENHNISLIMQDVQFHNSSINCKDEKKTAMLKSHEERISTPAKDNKLNIKVDFMLLFIVFVCINLFNYLVFQNSLLFVQLAIILFIVYFSVMFMNVFVYQTMEEAIVNTFHDYDTFEKAEQLSVIVVYNNKESVLINDCRSRYEKFVYFNRKNSLVCYC